jgi:hypothetical protein
MKPHTLATIGEWILILGMMVVLIGAFIFDTNAVEGGIWIITGFGSVILGILVMVESGEI